MDAAKRKTIIGKCTGEETWKVSKPVLGANNMIQKDVSI